MQGVEGLALPPALRVRQRFLFEIRILPVNDPPALAGGPRAYPRNGCALHTWLSKEQIPIRKELLVVAQAVMILLSYVQEMYL